MCWHAMLSTGYIGLRCTRCMLSAAYVAKRCYDSHSDVKKKEPLISMASCSTGMGVACHCAWRTACCFPCCCWSPVPPTGTARAPGGASVTNIDPLSSSASGMGSAVAPALLLLRVRRSLKAAALATAPMSLPSSCSNCSSASSVAMSENSGRASSELSQHLLASFVISGGAPGGNSGLWAWLHTLSMSLCTGTPRNALRPVNISYSRIPYEYTSAALDSRPLVSTSGAMCVMVPACMPLTCVCPWSIWMLNPKSATCGIEAMAEDRFGRGQVHHSNRLPGDF
mmetsp:Transcript_26004/g.72835  ORF Transcript_26004/g.72835 Transcript_26004/m.72835 type:complete len:283 (-) Transcript_26004:401-1249(-)